MPRGKKKTARLQLSIAHVVDPVASVILTELDRRTERALSLCEQIVQEERLARSAGLADMVTSLRRNMLEMDKRLRSIENVMSHGEEKIGTGGRPDRSGGASSAGEATGG
jgi:hypothetical protein